MKFMVRVSALILILSLAACSQKGFDTNLTVESKPVPGVDFSKYQTWSFGRQGEYPLTGNETLDDPHFRKAVGDHTINVMDNLGYQHVNSDPDLLLMFHVIIEDRYDEVKMNPNYQDFDMQWATVSEDDVWKEGSLLLFLIDPRTGKQVWGSTATAELAKDSDFGTKKKRFNEVVTEMLSDLPARPKS